jgi:hypothetical protein
MKRFLTLLLVCGASTVGWAQSHRGVTNLAVQPELQVEYGFHSGDYLVLGLRGLRYSGYPDPSPRPFSFDEQQVRLGYEHFWNEHWSWGATARLASVSPGHEIVPELLLRHRSVVGPLTFGQRLSVEHTFPDNQGYVGGPGPDGKTFARLRLDLEKQLPVGSISLRPRLSYELAAHVRLQKEENERPERPIDFGSLRAEVGFRLSDHVDFTPWFALATDYYKTEIQYDPLTNKPVAGGDFNKVSPILGLDVRFTLLPAAGAPSRQQLPTQH